MDEWTELQLEQPLQEGKPTTGTAPDGTKFAVGLAEGKPFVCDNRCRHQGGPLGAGYLLGNTLACPWHGWEYDVTDGRCFNDPERAIKVYETKVEGQAIYIKIQTDRSKK